jgi:hypothetical protein
LQKNSRTYRWGKEKQGEKGKRLKRSEAFPVGVIGDKLETKLGIGGMGKGVWEQIILFPFSTFTPKLTGFFAAEAPFS